VSTQPKSFITPEQYLEIERKAEFRSEYYNGEMFAMSGGSRWHDWIAVQLTMLVQQHLRGRDCQAFSANMRVVTPSGLYTIRVSRWHAARRSFWIQTLTH
jgi:Uma2 family endonuclease